ncbi:MAG: hypothetical protein ABI318_20410, partial [Chthoniobacteraceae bacterium]
MHSLAFKLSATAVLLLAVGLILFGSRVKRRYERWTAGRRVGRAEEYYAKGDFQRAILDARFALQSDPMDAQAVQVMAKSLEAMGAPAAIAWRQRLHEIHPEDAENTLAWAKDAMAAKDVATAAEVLGKLKPEDRNRATYHDLMAGVALSRRNLAGAEAHWAEAEKLDPKEDNYRLSLAMLQMRTGPPAVRAAATEVLDELSAKPNKRLAVLRTLLGDALNHGEQTRAKELADALASDPQAGFGEKLARLETLWRLKDPEASAFLLKLKEDAMPKPAQLYNLLAWMNDHDLALMVLEWSAALPLDALAKPPVCITVADAVYRSVFLIATGHA